MQYELKAIYLRTVRGYGCYKVLVDGEQYSVGGLPDVIHGIGYVTWTLIPGTPNYYGARR